MNTNGVFRKHWFHVSSHFATDALLFAIAFVVAMLLRFGGESAGSLWAHWPSFVLGGFVFSSTTYIAGLYSTHSAGRGMFVRSLMLFVCVLAAVLFVIGGTYLNSARPLGRGVMLLAAIASYAATLLHHIVILHGLRNSKERVAYVVSSAFDEAETRLFASFGGRNLEFAGIVVYGSYQPTGIPRPGENGGFGRDRAAGKDFPCPLHEQEPARRHADPALLQAALFGHLGHAAGFPLRRGRAVRAPGIDQLGMAAQCQRRAPAHLHQKAEALF